MWLVVAGLGVAAGFITVKIPGIESKFSLADTFVFANIILFGPVVGGITAALDGLAASMRCKTKNRRWEFALFNIAGLALSAYIAGGLFFRTLGHGPAYLDKATKVGEIFLPVLLLAVFYYLLSSMAVSVIIALEGKKKVVRLWRENFLWGMTTYIACALGAIFIAAGITSVTPVLVVAVLIILAAIYLSLRASAERVPQVEGRGGPTHP